MSDRPLSVQVTLKEKIVAALLQRATWAQRLHEPEKESFQKAATCVRTHRGHITTVDDLEEYAESSDHHGLNAAVMEYISDVIAGRKGVGIDEAPTPREILRAQRRLDAAAKSAAKVLFAEAEEPKVEEPEAAAAAFASTIAAELNPEAEEPEAAATTTSATTTTAGPKPFVRADGSFDPVSDEAQGDISLLYASDHTDLSSLTTVHEACRFLPKDVYEEIVRKTVVCCVDIALRSPDGKYLIVQRATHPVKGYWWLPGGRLLKGETFFEGAVRKCAQEAGVTDARPIKTLGVWNTFFETSAHMEGVDASLVGTQTVNAIVLCETDFTAEQMAVKLDATSEAHKWITPAEAVSNAETGEPEDKYVQLGLARAQAVYTETRSIGDAAAEGESSSGGGGGGSAISAAKLGAAAIAALAVFGAGFIIGAGYVCIAMKKRKDAQAEVASRDARTLN